MAGRPGAYERHLARLEWFLRGVAELMETGTRRAVPLDEEDLLQRVCYERVEDADTGWPESDVWEVRRCRWNRTSR